VNIRRAVGLSDQEQELVKSPADLRKEIEAMTKKMHEAAGNLEFEEAAKYRDKVKKLQELELDL